MWTTQARCPQTHRIKSKVSVNLIALEAQHSNPVRHNPDRQPRHPSKSEGRFGKQDFVYLPIEDVYRCPAGEKLAYHYTNEEDGKTLRRYWTTACPSCPLKSRCTTGAERRITRWEHEHVS